MQTANDKPTNVSGRQCGASSMSVGASSTDISVLRKYEYALARTARHYRHPCTMLLLRAVYTSLPLFPTISRPLLVMNLSRHVCSPLWQLHQLTRHKHGRQSVGPCLHTSPYLRDLPPKLCCTGGAVPGQFTRSAPGQRQAKYVHDCQQSRKLLTRAPHTCVSLIPLTA